MVAGMETKVLVNLKVAMLEAKTVEELVALIIDNTHEEMMQVYWELAPEHQARIEGIWQMSGALLRQ